MMGREDALLPGYPAGELTPGPVPKENPGGVKMKNSFGRTKKQQREWNITHGHDLPTVKRRKKRAVLQKIQKESRRQNR